MCSFRALLVAMPRQQGTQHSWAQREGSILSLCQAAVPFALGSCIPHHSQPDMAVGQVGAWQRAGLSPASPSAWSPSLPANTSYPPPTL